jgi:hypothetical protein
MFTLILPAAGASTRYPNMRPKWSLTHPNGELMIVEGMSGIDLSNFDRIVMTAMRYDVVKYGLQTAIYDSFEKFGLPFELIGLDTPTSSQSETVAITIQKANIEGEIYIKDCDDYFVTGPIEPNMVSVYSLYDMEEVIAKNKSYVTVDHLENVTNIVEKRIISDKFCCGGYSFSSAEQFVETFKALKATQSFSRPAQSTDPEIFISHVIFEQVLDGKLFKTSKVTNYEDWGTLADWNKYKERYKTIFIDLDGVLVNSSSEMFEPIWGTTGAIQENVDIINEMYDSGTVRVIITTSRKSSFKEVTLKQLDRLDIRYHQIIFDLMHCERVLVNDYSPTNSFPTATAVNMVRNSHDLKELI